MTASRLGRTAGLALLCLCAGRCDGQPAIEPPFVERAAEVGLDFVHFNGMSGERLILETMSAGAALFDYDGDGDLDAYLVQGAILGDKPTFPPRETTPLDRLFRNELAETGTLRFVDVTESARIVASGYGMGVAAGDYDGDGRVDLYVTSFGPNLLLRNAGDGTFEEVPDAGGARDDRWSASAAFCDYDADGDLDLFVTAYVDFNPANPGECFNETTAREYCGPSNYDPLPDRLFRNRGDGSFEDVTAGSGIALAYGAGLGVVCADFDTDGLLDIYVANDDDPNQLWIQRPGGRFEDRALIAGCALDAAGETEAGMGVDAGDFDGDGDEDLFLSHLKGETSTLYVNDGRGVFEDRTLDARLEAPSREFTGFGTAWIDYDNDGHLDLIVVNGEVKTIAALVRRGDPYPLHQRNQIFRNLGDGTFEDLTERAGLAFALSEVSRGAAFGDVDNDGDTDVLITNNSGPARLLVNEVGNRNHWLGLRIVHGSPPRDALNAVVEVEAEDGTVRTRSVRAAASYLSSNDPRVLVGLGRNAGVRAVRVRWPDGGREEWSGIESDRYVVLERGSGTTLGP